MALLRFFLGSRWPSAGCSWFVSRGAQPSASRFAVPCECEGGRKAPAGQDPGVLDGQREQGCRGPRRCGASAVERQRPGVTGTRKKRRCPSCVTRTRLGYLPRPRVYALPVREGREERTRPQVSACVKARRRWRASRSCCRLPQGTGSTY